MTPTAAFRKNRTISLFSSTKFEALLLTLSSISCSPGVSAINTPFFNSNNDISLVQPARALTSVYFMPVKAFET